MTKTGEAARPQVTVEAESFTEFLLMHRKAVTVAAIVVIAGVASAWLWIRSDQIRETKAAAAFREAEAIFSAGNRPLARTELEKITGRYAGTTAGTQASMLTAQLLYDEGKFAEGIAILTTAEPRAPESLRAGVLSLVAGGEEGAGRPAGAATAYRRAAESARFATDRDSYRMEQARALVAASQSQEALVIFREIADKDDSPFAGEARIRAGELTGKP